MGPLGLVFFWMKMHPLRQSVQFSDSDSTSKLFFVAATKTCFAKTLVKSNRFLLISNTLRRQPRNAELLSCCKKTDLNEKVGRGGFPANFFFAKTKWRRRRCWENVFNLIGFEHVEARSAFIAANLLCQTCFGQVRK